MTAGERYQSRLFKFIAGRSQRIRSASGLQWRRLKLFARWSLQALLFPLFALSEALKMPERQLPGGRSEPPDAALLPVLQQAGLLIPAESGGAALTPTLPSTLARLLEGPLTLLGELGLLPPRPPVRGVATDLNSRALVLVGPDNRILELSASQQQHLQERISWELSEGGRARRLGLPWPPLPEPSTVRSQLAGITRHLLQPCLEPIYRPLPLRALTRRTRVPQLPPPTWLRHLDRLWERVEVVSLQLISPRRLPAAAAAPALLPAAIALGTATDLIQSLPPEPLPLPLDQPWDSRPTAPEPAPTTLDATVTQVGYVRDPISLLLEWLDRSVAWLEALLLALWGWLTRPWRSPQA